MWGYTTVLRAEFEKRKDFVEQIMLELGCEIVDTEITYMQETSLFGEDVKETWCSNRPLYKFQNGFYRIDEVLFAEKPFIVLEYADTEDMVRMNAMEDCDPFPYGLSDEDTIKEVRYSLGIEPYPQS